MINIEIKLIINITDMKDKNYKHRQVALIFSACQPDWEEMENLTGNLRKKRTKKGFWDIW